MENKKYCDAECKDGHPCDRKINIYQESCHQHLKNKIVDYWTNKNLQLILEDLQNKFLDLLKIKDKIKYLTINTDDYLYKKYIFKDTVPFNNYVDSKYKQKFRDISNIGSIDDFNYVLTNTPKVKQLYFNNIGHKGVIVIADMLKKNITLPSIDLRYNNIGHKGVIVIAEALKINTTVNILY